MLKRSASFGAIITLVYGCASTQKYSEISSRFGEETGANHPEVALVTSMYGDGTGVMLSPTLLLTVNHVVEGNKRSIRVFPGYSNTRRSTTIQVDDIDAFSTDPRKEVALVKLKTPANSQFATLSSSPASRHDLFSIGYGINTGTQTPYRAQLRADVKLRGYRGIPEDFNKASISASDSLHILMGEIIPGPKGQLPCSGDSGGPVFQRYENSNVVVGLMSHLYREDDLPQRDTSTFCRKATHARYVPVHLYKEWIDSTAAAWGETINWTAVGDNVPAEPPVIEPPIIEPPITDPPTIEPPRVEPNIGSNPLGNGWFISRSKIACEDILKHFYSPQNYFRDTLKDKPCHLVVGHQNGRVNVLAKNIRTDITLRGLARLGEGPDHVDVGNDKVTMRIQFDASRIKILRTEINLELIPE